MENDIYIELANDCFLLKAYCFQKIKSLIQHHYFYKFKTTTWIKINMELRVRDKVLFKTERDVIKHIQKINKRYTKAIAWLQGTQNIASTKEAEILKNILISTQGYTKYIENGAFKDIQLLALGVRSVLENLARARFIMQSDENLDRWLSEVITDQKAIIKGFLSLSEQSNTNVKSLEKELTRLDSLRDKYNFPVVKQPQPVKAMTDAVGLVDDY